MREKSIRQESSLGKIVGGKATMASGALWFQKNDVVNERFLFECKTTEKCHYDLKEEDLLYLLKNAYSIYKIPCFVIQLNNRNNQENIFILNQADIEIDLTTNETLKINKKLKLTGEHKYPVLIESRKRKYIVVEQEVFLNLFFGDG
jgi:hypothetical protein